MRKYWFCLRRLLVLGCGLLFLSDWSLSSNAGFYVVKSLTSGASAPRRFYISLPIDQQVFPTARTLADALCASAVDSITGLPKATTVSVERIVCPDNSVESITCGVVDPLLPDFDLQAGDGYQIVLSTPNTTVSARIIGAHDPLGFGPRVDPSTCPTALPRRTGRVTSTAIERPFDAAGPVASRQAIIAIPYHYLGTTAKDVLDQIVSQTNADPRNAGVTYNLSLQMRPEDSRGALLSLTVDETSRILGGGDYELFTPQPNSNTPFARGYRLVYSSALSFVVIQPKFRH